MTQVARWYSKLFGSSKPLLGVVHVAPLPGTPRSRLPFARVAARALQDARSYLDAGLHGVIVENFGDAPFACGRAEPHTIACLTRIAAAIKEIAGARPVGVNVLRNDAAGALGVALAAELDFIRVNVLTGAAVTDQGLIQGDAAALLRYRRALRARVAIFADVRVKHATQLRAAPVALQVNELLERALADAVLVTGAATGSPPAARHVREVKAAAGAAPVLVASGASLANISALALLADGFIAGTALQAGGRTGAPVQAARARAMLRALERLSGERARERRPARGG